MVGCHTGNPLVFEAQGIKVYAGGNTRQGGWQNWKGGNPDVAIGPEGVIHTRKTRDVFPDGWACSTKLEKQNTPKLVVIDWPDYGIPSNITHEFWPTLVEDFKVNDVKTVLCSCMGGHGRTGVQLSILAHLMIPESNRTWKDASELVLYIRDSYCNNAVEGINQQKYIADVLNIPVGESLFVESKPSKIQWDSNDMDDLLSELDESDRKPKRKSRKKTEGAKFKKQKNMYDYIDESGVAYTERRYIDEKGNLNVERTKVGKEYHANTDVAGHCLLYDPTVREYVWNPVKTTRELMKISSDLELVDMDKEDRNCYCSECNMGFFHELEMIEEPEAFGMSGRVCKYCIAENFIQDAQVKFDEKKIKIGKTRWYPAIFYEQDMDGLCLVKDTVGYKDREIFLKAVEEEIVEEFGFRR